MHLYPLAQAGNPPAPRYIDIAGQLFDGIARMDDTFYDSLARMVYEEPVQTRDLVAMAQLRSLGIEKGKAFKPDHGDASHPEERGRRSTGGIRATIDDVKPWWPGTHWGSH